MKNSENKKMMKGRKKWEIEEVKLLFGRNLKCLKQYRLSASSNKLIPIYKLGASDPPTYYDANAELTDHGRQTVYAMTFVPPAAATEDDFRAHVYFSARSFMINASILPAEESATLVKIGELYRFVKFSGANAFPVVGVLKQMKMKLNHGSEQN